MSEYIITDEQLKTAAEAYSEHELSLPMTDVFISGDKLPEIVRCRDCAFFAAGVSTADEHGGEIATGNLCEWTELWVEPYGFCSWGARREP